ncbi:hypothetical protein F53441_10900 [Fusarium austroafricanum]|uniref:Uncharacterized protein n=1 Tax=Fusarium austroafricanum TaxID=2364996 RepID=A0A8H4NUX9_9HYPO|nr:hypothetical protein F53441_10900 [Fusarium austroafricanum]
MKFSAVAVLAFAQGIVAIPSLLGQLKHGHTTDEDITLSIKVSQAPMRKEDFYQKSPQICWLLCASEEIHCPEGLVSHEEDGCWTCCKED